MKYPQHIIEFFKILTNRSMATKAYKNRDKFKNSFIKHKDKFDLLESDIFPSDLPLNERTKWIADEIYERKLCRACGKPVPLSHSSGEYPEYCNQKCYSSDKSAVNNSKKLIIDGIIYNSMSEAIKELKSSNYLIKLRLYSPSFPKYEYHPDHETQLNIEKNELGKWSEYLLDKEFLLSKKKLNISMNEISEDLGVKLDQLRLAFYLHDIDTQYDQIPKESSELLKDEIWLRDQISTLRVSELADVLSCSVSAIHHACTLFKIEIPTKSSAGEEELAKYIISLGFDIIQRSRKIIYPLEIDIYIPSLSVALEYNGVYHHREDEDRHSNKREKCEKVGVRLIQIFEDDWKYKQNIVKSKIKHILNISDSDKVFARKCEVECAISNEVNSFYDNHHIYGNKNCSHHYVLKHDDKIVAAMSFINEKLERFATACNVVGGFSKLLSFAEKSQNLKTIVTFADLCWSDPSDNVYTTNGFVLDSITRPNYFWVVKGKRESRLKYQKHKLTKLDTYDINKTEKQIMEAMGYYRIFDAGHAKLIKQIQ